MHEPSIRSVRRVVYAASLSEESAESWMSSFSRSAIFQVTRSIRLLDYTTGSGSRKGRTTMRLFVVVSLLIIFSAPAHAYIDAGSGSYMLQIALAGIMAVVFSIKLSWQKLKSFASELFRSKSRANSGRSA